MYIIEKLDSAIDYLCKHSGITNKYAFFKVEQPPDFFLSYQDPKASHPLNRAASILTGPIASLLIGAIFILESICYVFKMFIDLITLDFSEALDSVLAALGLLIASLWSVIVTALNLIFNPLDLVCGAFVSSEHPKENHQEATPQPDLQLSVNPEEIVDEDSSNECVATP